jgi:hypothetical protein
MCLAHREFPYSMVQNLFWCQQRLRIPILEAVSTRVLASPGDNGSSRFCFSSERPEGRDIHTRLTTPGGHLQKRVETRRGIKGNSSGG